MHSINKQLLQRYSKLELLAKQVVEGFITGLHKSPFHGFSVEFAEHRLYNTGESTRHIDWKQYAKTEKLFIKKYEEETNLRCHLVIDCSSSMLYPLQNNNTLESPNKLFFAIYGAAVLIEILKRQRDAVGLSLFAEKLLIHTPAKSSTVHHRFLYNRLEELMEQTEKEPAQSFVTNNLHYIAESIHKRSLVVLFSDMMDNSENENELFSALQHLKHNKHEVILFNVYDKKDELNFAFENRPYRFIDLETKEEVKLNPQEIKQQYKEEIAKKQETIKLKCAQYGVELVQCDIHEGFHQVMWAFLVKRAKLF
ncbi:MAG: DUF58 domain-containing protein [Flavobacteriales bacterium]|nr:DUF58 domain-containing protein [Flavobacteriales bacterium]